MTKEARTRLMAYLVLGIVVGGGAGAGGWWLYANWSEIGLPSPQSLVREAQEGHTGQVEGAMVVEGNTANYLKYINREDVFVVVNFYQKKDQFADDLKLDLKRLSARQGGKVILMNVDRREQGKIASQAKVTAHRDVRLMHGGKLLGHFTNADLVWDVEGLVEKHQGLLKDPVRQAAAERDPYAESLQPGGEKFVPNGVTPN